MGSQRNEPLITVNKKFYDQLVDDSNFLDCLKACGVNNWDGYSQAYQMFHKNEEELDEETDN